MGNSFTTEEILALIQVGSATIPLFKQLWDKIAANSNGTVRPIADILGEADTNFDDVIATATKELEASKQAPQVSTQTHVNVETSTTTETTKPEPE